MSGLDRGGHLKPLFPDRFDHLSLLFLLDLQEVLKSDPILGDFVVFDPGYLGPRVRSLGRLVDLVESICTEVGLFQSLVGALGELDLDFLNFAKRGSKGFELLVLYG